MQQCCFGYPKLRNIFQYAVFTKLTKFSLKCHPIHPEIHKDPSIDAQT